MLLVEREKPLARLNELVSGLHESHGLVVLLSGEAGIGKTSLLLELVEQLKLKQSEDYILRWGACDPLDTPRVLGPLHDMYNHFGEQVQSQLTEDPSFAHLSRAILNELEQSIKPCVMVIEDVHWADNATLDLMKCLCRRISFLNACLILSYRSDEVDVSHPLAATIGDFPQKRTNRIELQPLSENAVEILATASGRKAANLHNITGGNPFFVTELLANDDEKTAPVSASIQDAIGARLARLESTHRDFLKTISIIPHAINNQLLTALFGEDGFSLTSDCVERRFLKHDTNLNSFRFRHELARLGTLSSVPVFKRERLHARIYQLLEDGSIPTTLDQKLYHANGARFAEATLQLAQKAARNAASAGAHAEAASHYATALKYISVASTETIASLYENWSYEAALVEINDETIGARHEALVLWEELGRIDKVGENLRWLSRQHWYRGESELADRYIEEAISTLESTDPSAEKAMAYSLKSQYYMLNDAIDDAAHWGKLALELEEKFPSPEVRVHALCNLASAMLERDNVEGYELMKRSLELALEHDFHEHAARVYTNTAWALVSGLDWERAEQTLSDGIVFDAKHDLDSWTYYLIGVQAQLRLEQSRFEEAQTIASEVIAMENQTLLMKLPSLLVLSRVNLRLGHADATEQLATAMEHALSVGEPPYVLRARVGLIEAAWHNGDTLEARRQIELQQELGVIPGNCWRGAEFAVWAHRYGLPEGALQGVAGGLPEPYQLEVDNRHDEAAAAWIAKGSDYRAALALLFANDPFQVPRYKRALELLRECGALGTLRKLKAMAMELGIENELSLAHRGPRKQSRKHPLGLTAKEQEIFPLLVEGLSNAEISETLSRSQRTVENHVASILKKLNVKNRMEVMLRGKNEPWLLGIVAEEKTRRGEFAKKFAKESA